MALAELAGVFLKLGSTAFGGPAVHIALLEGEVVHRRKWMTREEFVDLLGATNLIPGPNSTEMAIHIGLRRGGWKGLVVAGSCFIGPAFLITLACAWCYVRYAAVPQLQGVLYGIKPVVLAIVVQALWRLSQTALTKPIAIVVSILAFIANLSGVHELIVLAAAGVALPLINGGRRAVGAVPPPALIGPFLPLAATPATATMAATTAGLMPLFGFFLKVGSVLYGSGYVLLAFLRADLVERWHWMNESQLLDAVAVGQITPGPLFTTATFIGYVLGGGWGAVAATVGIFLPAFVFVALSAPFVPRLRASRRSALFLDGVNAASLSLMAATTIQLLRGAFSDTTTVLLGIAAAATLLWTKVNPIWLVLAGGAVGWFVHRS